MKKNIFSLILTSVDRLSELYCFFLSIRIQDKSNFDIEIIFIDQSKGLFKNILEEFSDLNIISINSERCSLSAARNLGLKHANGSIFAFPDDDCVYYPNTLVSAYNSLLAESKEVVVGRIYDRNVGHPILKRWPNNSRELCEGDVFNYASSITLFTKLIVNFDERMGVGAMYGSCEDVDTLLTLSKDVKSILQSKHRSLAPQQLA